MRQIIIILFFLVIGLLGFKTDKGVSLQKLISDSEGVISDYYSKEDTLKVLKLDLIKINTELESVKDSLISDSLSVILDSLSEKQERLEEYLVKSGKQLKKQRKLFSSLLDTIYGEISFNFRNHNYIGFIVDTSYHELSLHLKDSLNRNYSNLFRLNNYLTDRAEEVLCLTNAGMYTPRSLPEGLYIEEGKKLFELDTMNKPNLNFYMQPNGVFYQDSLGFHVMATEEYISKRSDSVYYATQSGPMLIINGEHHPAFNYYSKSQKLRSGVGVISKSKIVLLKSHGANVNFHEFATVYKEVFNCENALFLDGVISRMYLPQMNPKELGGNFGPIISVVKK